MDKKTQQITTGAAVTAIFCLMLFMNRQTGGFFEEFLLFFFPLPMVAYAVQYGWKSSFPVLAAMARLSILFGNLLTIFYAVTEAVIGLVLGGCLYKKVEPMKTILAVMLLSAAANVTNTILLADLFGVGVGEQIAQMQEMMSEVFEKANVPILEEMLTAEYLLQMMVISMVLLGLIQGFVTYQLTIIVLRKLRFQIPKAKSIFTIYPPRWIGFFAVLFFLNYGAALTGAIPNPLLANTLQVLGICGNLYLTIFGFLAVVLYVRVRFPKLRKLSALFCVLLYFTLPMGILILGFFYTSTGFHQSLMELPAEG